MTQTQSYGNRVGEGVRSAVANAGEKMGNGEASIERAAQEVKSGAAELGTTLKKVSSEALGEAQHMVSDAYEAARAEGERRAEQLEHEIQRAPFAAIGLAFFGGILITALLKK